jgi:hypothetical protein
MNTNLAPADGVDCVAEQADTAPYGANFTPSPPPGLAAGGGISLARDVGPEARLAAVSALIGHLGLSVTGDFDAALAGKADYYLWTGRFGTGPGRYWIPALYRCADLPAAIDQVHTDPDWLKKRTDKGYTTTRDDAAYSVQHFHAGLGKDRVALSVAAGVEIDHLPRTEQEAAYAALTAATSLNWAVQAFSGGKSVHAYLAFDRALDPADPIRLEIQQLMIACLEGDTQIIDPGRLMRLPGWDGDRNQPIVHLDPTAHYSPEHIRDCLANYATVLGITNIIAAVDALKVAKSLADKAKHESDAEAKQDLLDHAALLRLTRGDPLPADLALAAAMSGKTAPAARASSRPAKASRNGSQPTSTGGTVLRLDPALLDAFVGVTGRFHPPCCPTGGGSGTPGGSVMSGPNEPIRIWCYRCGHTIMAERVPANVTPTFVATPTTPPPSNRLPTTLAFGAVDVRCERHLSGLPQSPKMQFIRSPRETGKTTVSVGDIQAGIARNPHARIVITALRQALVSTYVDRLAHLGFVDYRDIKGEIQADRVVVCLDSLPRLELFVPGANGHMVPKPWDLIFIDESEQTIRHMAGATVAKHTTMERLCFTLTTLLSNTKRVLFADADLGVLTVRTARRLLHQDVWQPQPDEILIVNDAASKLLGRQADLYVPTPEGRGQLYRELWADWQAGSRVAVDCTSLIEAKRITQELLRLRPSAKVLTVTSETSGDHADFTRAPDAWTLANQPDAIVYSPSLGTGIDLAIRDYWDRVFCFVTIDGGITTFWDAMQGIERVRHPKDPRRQVWVQGGEIWGETNLDKLRANLLTAAAGDLKASIQYCPQPDGSWIRLPWLDMSIAIQGDIRVTEAYGRADISASVRTEMVRLGWATSEVPEDVSDEVLEEVAAAKGDKKVIRQADLDRIVNALPYATKAEAEAVSRTHATLDDRARASKTFLIDLIGPDVDVTDTLVKDFLHGRLRKRIELFGAAAAILDKDAGTTAAVGWRGVGKWMRTSHARGALETAKKLAFIVKAYGITSLDPGKCPTPSVVIPIKEHSQGWDTLVPDPGTLAKVGAIGKSLRFKLGDDWQTDQPFVVLGQALSMLGLRGSSVREKAVVNGKRKSVATGTYRVDVAPVQDMTDLTARWRWSLLDAKDKAADPDGYRIRKAGVCDPDAAPLADVVEAALHVAAKATAKASAKSALPVIDNVTGLFG